MAWQKAQLDIEKHGGGIMLVIELVRNVNYGKSEKMGHRSRKKCLNVKKKTGRAVYHAKCNS